MKKLLLALFLITTSTALYAQSNSDIAKVYIKRTNKAIEEKIDFNEAKLLFEKAMGYTDTITSANIAKLGARIYFELEDYESALKYFTQYFALAQNKTSEDYMNQMDLFVTTKEEIQIKLELEKKAAAEKLAKEKELRKIDSLKTVWTNKANALSLKIDTLYNFNKNNIAVYQKGEYFGLIDDLGNKIIKADTYKEAISFDGYILLADKKEAPTKIYSYNTNTKSGSMLPSPAEINPLSTNFGQIMLPRANGRLITYLNNSYKVLVYDLEAKKVVRVANLKNLLKSLKNNDIIDKFNKEGDLKVNKEWYGFAGHLGGGIYPLTFEKKHQLFGFLCSIDGTVLTTSSNYSYLGAFYDGKIQGIKDGETVWLNQNGTTVSAPKDLSGEYAGTSKVVKLENGNYQIQQDEYIVLGDQKLGTQSDFITKNK